eukprot:c15294_g1_i1 orf=43-780(+)
MGSSVKELPVPSSSSTPALPIAAAVHGDAEESPPLPLKEPQPAPTKPTSQFSDGSLALVPVQKTSPSSTGQHAEPPLRVLLSDPLTGALMDDAMLLPCGHSFGSGGIHRILQSSACLTCGVHVSRESLTPNFAVQAVVKAFRREQRNRKALSRKRQRERFIQDHSAIADHATPRAPRLREVREVQFPFKVGDRVMIKGNKRTPDRFVNREATITAQCLNGWFMLKTSDNGEVVKLQHRSLIKIES